MSLKRGIRKAIERGSATYGIVEAVNADLVTVVVVGTGSKVTNLNYLGSIAPEPGDLVILDYSAGPKPLVRLVDNQEEFPEDPSMFVPQVEAPGPLGDSSYFAGIDVGMGCTTRAFSNRFPNEPHDVYEPWLQYWGFNLSGTWINAIYDTDNIYGDAVYTGPQYFNINRNGKYLITLSTGAQLTGAFYGGSPLGILRARVLRYWGSQSYPILIGIAEATDFHDAYFMDIDKQVYLSAGDVLAVEFVYTGEVYAYDLKDSTNPLKWITTGNEFVFKIQLLTEATVIEPPPITPERIGIVRRSSWDRSQVADSWRGYSDDISSINITSVDADMFPGPGKFQVALTDTYKYYFQALLGDEGGQYQAWRVDQEGNSDFKEIADGQVLEYAQAYSLGLLWDGAVVYRWVWTDTDDQDFGTTPRHEKLNIVDFEDDSITTLASWESCYSPGCDRTQGWAYSDLRLTSDFYYTPDPFEKPGVVYYDGNYYVLTPATYLIEGKTPNGLYDALYFYDGGPAGSNCMKWRVFNAATGDLTEISTDYYSAWVPGEDVTYGSLRNTSWFQDGSKLYTVVNFQGGIGLADSAVHVIDLASMSMSVYSIRSAEDGYNEKIKPFFDYSTGRIYMVHKTGSQYDDDIVYWDTETKSITFVATDLNDVVERFIGNREKVYWQYEVSALDDTIITNAKTNNTINIGALGTSGKRVVCGQVSQDENRIWVIDVPNEEMKGYHETESTRTISLSATHVAELTEVYSFDLIDNCFLVGGYDGSNYRLIQLTP